MRLMRMGLLVAIAAGVLGIDVGQSVRTSSISDGSAQAKPHRKRRKRSRKRRRNKNNQSPPPATEM